MKKRDEIPVCDTWNLADILPSDEAWEALFLETERELAGYKEFKDIWPNPARCCFSV